LKAWVQLKTPATGTLLVSWTWFGLELLIFGIGALVIWRRPGDVSAALFFVLCAVQVVMFLGAFHWPSLLDTRWLLYPFLFSTVVQAPLMLHFHLLFPRPPALVRRWPRSTLAAVYVLPCLWLVMMFACLLRVTWLYESGSEPAALTGQLRVFTALMYVYLGLSLAMFLASQALLVRNFLRSRTLAERNQVKWLLASMFVAVWPVGYLLYTSTWQPDEFVFGLRSKVMLYATSAVFALGYAVSITRYKLRQASRIVDRGLVYVAISFAATALFCGLVGQGTMLLGRYYFSWENAAAAGLTAMLVVVLLGLLRDRFQRALDRRFHQQKYQLDKAMLRLSDAVDQLVEPAQLARQLLQSAREAVRADRGAVYLRDPAGERHELVAWTGWPAAPQRELDNDLAAELVGAPWAREMSAPHSTLPLWKELRFFDASLALSLELDGDAVGIMLLGPKQDATPYTPEDRAFLAALVQTTALALRSARGHRTIESLRSELQSKVEKIAEQQQRIHYLQSELLNQPEAGRTALSPSRDSSAPTQTTPPITPRGMLGSSAALRSLLEEAAKVARSSSSVLIRGESGTGKERLAQAIHEQSPRATGPFVAVHCAALSAGLLESELFGHVRGAFTGADRDKTGRFELADKGTLFLDEIGDISPETQTKLLRVLQERSFERVGGTRTLQVDVRLITATHQDLEGLIRAGRFREDLYYRLNVISLRCPALRERREDVFELALHFLRRYAADAGKSIVQIEENTLEALTAYSWPGNIRQLENAIQRAVVLAEGNSLRRSDLPPEVLHGERAPLAAIPRVPRTSPRRRRTTVSRAPAERVAITALDQELESVERGRLIEAIARAEGNKAAAARLLGLPRSTFFSKLRKFGLD
jgi:transcriptional regulator with GAF, ATPase, and Fis domain